MLKTSRNFSAQVRNVLFFGIIWGLFEAVFGTVLHLSPSAGNIAFWILYPIGFYCMMRLFSRTSSIAAVTCCGMIACALKLSSLFFYTPLLLVYTLKPAISILLETGITALVLGACLIRNDNFTYCDSLAKF